MECEAHAKDLAQGLPRAPLKLKKAFYQSAEGLPHAWLASISRVPIQTCGHEEAVEYEFECPKKRWESLPVNDETPGIRHCDECRQSVYFCSNKPSPTPRWAAAWR